MSVHLDEVFGGIRSCRKGANRAAHLLCQAIQKARLARVDLTDQDNPHHRGGRGSVGNVSVTSDLQFVVLEHEPTRIEVNGSTTNLQHQ